MDKNILLSGRTIRIGGLQDRLVKITLAATLTCIIVPLFIKDFIAEPIVVNGESMSPTLYNGEIAIANRAAYEFGKPGRGDIILFKYPDNPSIYYIKRIVGLPGETVTIHNGKVTIKNASHPEGFPLPEPYLTPAFASHDDGEWTIQSGKYFVMGDNRKPMESYDSRIFGPVDKQFIVAKAKALN